MSFRNLFMERASYIIHIVYFCSDVMFLLWSVCHVVMVTPAQLDLCYHRNSYNSCCWDHDVCYYYYY